ncbi:hypothetical protein HPB52_021296 [Rhipicephalus sanguineus]|uniref:HalX domain-containing protein n=1 Tax=Rhipicephalus sanguineus TaxID=34632 RepID=A0A9D4Q2Y1_RHISA|nr:hypothetical protein HPB52_021296 [Rhipicephalus sanguineus]
MDMILDNAEVDGGAFMGSWLMRSALVLVVAGLYIKAYQLYSKGIYRGTATMRGKTVIVTGSNAGFCLVSQNVVDDSYMDTDEDDGVGCPTEIHLETVSVDVNTVDDSSVETAEEREDRSVSSKRAALDPEKPTTETRSTSYQRLKKRIENIETSLDERFVSQREQFNKMFTVVNNSVAKLAEQMTQAIAALTVRMDDFEAWPPPLAGRPLQATGKPYARAQQQQTPLTDAETQHQQLGLSGGGLH